MSDSTACVEVNVGGQIFKASLLTLRRSGFLASLLDDDLTDDLKDKYGHLFLDRDPELFVEVLRLLRGHAARQLPDGRNTWSAVKAEADFYQVPVELLMSPMELAIPPDILTVRRLYIDDNCMEAVRRDEICMYSLIDLPPDLKTQIRIVAVEVNRHHSGSKTVFVVSRQVLEEASYGDRLDGAWERIERRCYHKITEGVELIIPAHPMEISREHCAFYVCVTYAVPPVGPVVAAGNQVVGVLRSTSRARSKQPSASVVTLERG